MSQRPAYNLTEEPSFDGCLRGGGRAFRFVQLPDLREIRYDPAGAVRLRFAAARVVVSGRNLRAL